MHNASQFTNLFRHSMNVKMIHTLNCQRIFCVIKLCLLLKLLIEIEQKTFNILRLN